jgi:glutamine synthetase
VSGQLNTRNRGDAVAGLRELGMDNETVQQAIDGGAVSAHEVAMARQAKAMRLADSAWTTRYLAGGLAEKREMGLLNVILSGAAA